MSWVSRRARCSSDSCGAPCRCAWAARARGRTCCSHLQQLRLGLAHQRHKHVSHPPALAAEAAHHLRQVVLELLRLRLQRRALGGALAQLWP